LRDALAKEGFDVSRITVGDGGASSQGGAGQGHASSGDAPTARPGGTGPAGMPAGGEDTPRQPASQRRPAHEGSLNVFI
jgi:hypothetical protein